MQILLSHAKSTFQDGKFIVFLQFLDLTLCINVLQVLFADAKSTFQDGKCIVYLQFLDLIMQFSEIQLITIFL